MIRTMPALVAIAAMSTAAAAELEATIEMCDGCHGDNGVSQWDDMPTIAGIDAFVGSEALYVYQDEARPCAMSDFRQGDTSRSATTMCAVAADLDDDTIEALAEHYAALPFVPAKQDFDAAKAAAGEAIHEDKCSRCHSDGGSNPDDEASILAGQWMGYLRTTFAEYASGEREQMDKMKTVMDALSAEDTEALIHYYASQQ
ncbi:MAG: c-type cytochrome [Pseudomonadota bacterium]